jgi:hypothetical protein
MNVKQRTFFITKRWIVSVVLHFFSFFIIVIISKKRLINILIASGCLQFFFLIFFSQNTGKEEKKIVYTIPQTLTRTQVDVQGEKNIVVKDIINIDGTMPKGSILYSSLSPDK